MWIRNILRSRALSLICKTAHSKRASVLVKRCPQYEIQALSFAPKYICFAFISLTYIAKAEDEQNEDDEVPKLISAISQSDEYFSVGKFEESAEVLEYFKDSDEVEVLWRISRALYNLSKNKEIKSAEKAALINEAYEVIERALDLDDNHYAIHKWMAILYDAKCSLDGIKARINALPVFKEHLMTAIELNPKDATSIYMLGQYMYSIADMSWAQKTLAKTLFGDPPEATFEEAFYYFSKAEEVEPNFYSANLLMLGKTCLKLKKVEAGCYWLKCAMAYPVRTDEDEEVRLEAEELLKNYPNVNSSSNEDQNFERD